MSRGRFVGTGPRLAAVVLASGLAACATLRPREAQAPASVPETTAAPAKPEPAPKPSVPPPPSPAKVSCVPKGFPHAPKYPDTDAALLESGGAADRYQLMAAGRLLRTRRLAELEKVVEGCR